MKDSIYKKIKNRVSVCWNDAVIYNRPEKLNVPIVKKVTIGELFEKNPDWVVVKNPKTFLIEKSKRILFKSKKKITFWSIPKGMITKVVIEK